MTCREIDRIERESKKKEKGRKSTKICMRDYVHLSVCRAVCLLARFGEQRVLAVGQADATLDRVRQCMTLKLCHGLTGIGNVFKLDEAHWSLRFCAETHALVSTALAENLTQLLFTGVRRQVTNIQSVARRILIGRIVAADTAVRTVTGGGNTGSAHLTLKRERSHAVQHLVASIEE